MWRLAWQQILHDRVRSGLTILAICAAIAVTLILRGFEQGLYAQSEKVVLDRGGQLVLTQAGVSNFLATRSTIPQLTRAAVEEVEGVAEANPITGFWVIYGPEGNKFPLLLLVYDTLGGPPNIIEGHGIEDGRELVIDLGLAKRFHLRPGDPMLISEFEFRVAGITQGSSALFSTFAYVSYDGLIDLLIESEIAPDISTFPMVSFLLTQLQLGADRAAVIQRIEQQVPEVDVFTPQQLAQQDRQLGKELFGPIMGVLISLSYIIGMLVIGLIIYSDVSARRRSFGVLKALGFRLSHISRGVLLQTLLLVSLAFPIGILLAWLAAQAIEWNMPVYKVQVLEIIGLWKTFIGVMFMAALGSLLPLRLIARTDPMLAFQVE